jgi:hypothetical protein
MTQQRHDRKMLRLNEMNLFTFNNKDTRTYAWRRLLPNANKLSSFNGNIFLSCRYRVVPVSSLNVKSTLI